ncbi:MAG: hypothetical protein V4557_09520 [Bacteroidota bacterium]
MVLLTTTLSAQQKKNLTPDDYGKWQAIGANDLSPNGEWVAYRVMVQEDNDTRYVDKMNEREKQN